MSAGLAPFDVTLRDGRTVHVRNVGAADEAEILQAFHRMGDDARFMRFMGFVREPNLARLRKVLASFPAGGEGIVATVPAADGIDIAGSATYLVGADPAQCEFSITVAGSYTGVGLARVLMSTLIAAAKQRGLREMEGFVLAANQPMLRLATRLGFSIVPDPDDRSVRLCRLRLTDEQPSAAAAP